MEPISVDEMEMVNTFSRMETMKKNTSEMTAFLFGDLSPSTHKACDVYDHFAIDWVYGSQLEWAGSLPEKQTNKILASIVK